jgi:hypothetical protein
MGGPYVLYKLRLGERVHVPFTEPREMLVYELGIDLGATDDDPTAQGQTGTAGAVASVFLRFRSASSILDCPRAVASVFLRFRSASSIPDCPQCV